MKIIVHRGTHQIGGSCIELTTDNTRIILDVGKELPPLADSEGVFQTKMPPVQRLFRGEGRGVDGLIVSHVHGDHVGHLADVHPDVPVYIGEMACRIYNMTARFTRAPEIVQPLHYLISGRTFQIGDFTITPYLVDHSAFDAYAFIIRVEGKTLIYTGDIRNHGNKEKATQYFLNHLPSQVDVLLMEGTMLGRLQEPVKTEQELMGEATQFMLTQQGRPIFILQSTTNIDRLVSFFKAASDSNRIFVIDIFAANIVSELNKSIPKPGLFKNVRIYYPGQLREHMFKEPGGAALMYKFAQYKISWEELSNRKDYCMLVRNNMAADLRRIGENLRHAGLIYSLWSGYLQTERMKRFMAFAESMEMKTIHLHTSGHAEVQLLQDIAKRCSPKRIIPIHTETPGAFSHFFVNVMEADDGEAIAL